MEILIKKGWKLNSNEKFVKSIIKAIERNEGMCPCVHGEESGDTRCPCEDYRLRNNCCCQLYVKNV